MESDWKIAKRDKIKEVITELGLERRRSRYRNVIPTSKLSDNITSQKDVDFKMVNTTNRIPSLKKNGWTHNTIHILS